MRKVVAAVLFLLAVAAFAIAFAARAPQEAPRPPAGPREARPDPPDFSFALIGDMPYRPEQEAAMGAIVSAINSDPEVAFTIHDGDIKGGGQACSDEVYAREARRFATFDKALIYTPGDNEWTDCFRANAGGFNALERLAHLRRTFFANPSLSLGARPQALDYQSAAYPENSRWEYGGITFATLHVVGSNNNRPATAAPGGNEDEFRARNQANIEWLRSTFERAKQERSAGVVIAMQANMLEGDLLRPSGFTDFRQALRREVAEFGKPVVLVHGDTHLFRVDEPLLDSGPPLKNLIRVETFGDLDIGWVRATVNLSAGEIFTFEPRRP
jgi:hypothetical protein